MVKKNETKQTPKTNNYIKKPEWIVGKSQLATLCWLVITNVDSNQAQVKNTRAQQEVW